MLDFKLRRKNTMADPVKISVVLAACDGEKFIRRQLESILDQNIVPDEILIGDDSVSDGTFLAVKDLLERHRFIKYFHHDPPRGVVENFEFLLEKAAGKFIFLADQDDRWRRDKVEKMAAFLENNPDCGGVFSNSLAVDEKDRSLGFSHWQMREFFPAGDRVDRAEFFRRVALSAHDTAIRRDVLREILPFPKLADVHDSWIGLAAALKSNWGCINEELTFYTIHSGNLSHPGKPTLFWKLKQARESIRQNSFAWTEQLFLALIERFGSTADLEDRLKYTSARKNMQVNFFARLPLILRELFSGRYHRFGRGWKSVIQDVFFRPFF